MTAFIRAVALAAGLLLAAPAPANTYDDMLHAIEIDDHRTIAALLKRGADVNMVNPKGDTLLMAAARSGKPEVLKTLLAARPRLNARNAYGESALMLAAINGRTEVVKTLIDAGADVNYTSANGHNALSVAIDRKQREVADVLVRAGAKR